MGALKRKLTASTKSARKYARLLFKPVWYKLLSIILAKYRDAAQEHQPTSHHLQKSRIQVLILLNSAMSGKASIRTTISKNPKKKRP